MASKDKKAAKPRAGLLAALDVGTTKVACFVARLGADGTARVVGVGHQPMRGMRGGAIVNLEEARDAVVNAVHAAEQMADETVRGVVVNLACGRPHSEIHAVEIPLNGHEIGAQELKRVLDQGRRFQAGDHREMIHSIPVGFRIDGTRGIRDPRGMFGDRLGVDMHVVSADTGPVRTLATCIESCHLSVESFVMSPFAAGLSVLVEDELELGATVIDMGGGTTSLAIFEDGEVVFTDAVPVGGMHVTTDIAHGLSTPRAAAERMKVLYGSALTAPGDDDAVIDVPQIGADEHDLPNHMPRSLLTGIIKPRLEETFELLRSKVEASGFGRSAGRRVVLTGGASQLGGVRDLAASIMDRQVRLGRPKRHQGLAESATGPAFATCAGLLTFGVQKQEDNGMGRFDALVNAARVEERRGMFTRLGTWLHEHF